MESPEKTANAPESGQKWRRKKICKRCYYCRKMDGIAGLCDFDRAYDNKACHYTLDTGKFREIEAMDMECPYFRPKRRERKVVSPRGTR